MLAPNITILPSPTREILTRVAAQASEPVPSTVAGARIEIGFAPRPVAYRVKFWWPWPDGHGDDVRRDGGRDQCRRLQLAVGGRDFNRVAHFHAEFFGRAIVDLNPCTPHDARERVGRFLHPGQMGERTVVEHLRSEGLEVERKLNRRRRRTRDRGLASKSAWSWPAGAGLSLVLHQPPCGLRLRPEFVGVFRGLLSLFVVQIR